MMQKHKLNIVEFISWLHQQDIKLSTNGEKLLYNAPKGRVTKELLKEIGDHKAEILQFLQQVNRNSNSTLPEIKPVSRDKPLPLSFSQERMWFIDRLEGEKAPYIEHSALRITGYLDINALKKSLSEIVRRHEVLRTSFQIVDGTPQQVIHSEASLKVEMVDLQQHSKTERETLLHQYIQQEASTPFNLEIAPLIRCSLLQVAQEEYVFVLTMHHIIGDVWSSGIFIQELSTLYRVFRAGEPSPLPELPIQYADFAAWQRKYLTEEILETQLNYWKQQLANLPTPELRTDRPRPAVQTFKGQRYNFALPPDLNAEIKAFSSQQATTLFMTLLAAFNILLYYSSDRDRDDIIVGTDVANRNRAETEGIIGFFVNQLVLRTDLSGNPSFRDLLERVRQVTLAAYDRQDLPFDQLVAALNPQRDLSRTPLFQSKFVLENVPLPSLKLEDLDFNIVEIDGVTTKFDLLLTLWETEQGLKGYLEYSTDLFNSSTIVQMLSDYETILKTVVARPNIDLQSLKEILTAAYQEKQATKEQEFQQARRHRFKNLKLQSTHKK